MKGIKTEGPYDLTRTLSPQMPVYPGDPQPKFSAYLNIEEDGANVTQISLGSHTGTHVDAPWHFLQDGNTIDKEPLGKFIGQAVITDLSHKRVGTGINRQDFDEYARAVVDGDILLIYTGTENAGKARSNFTYLETSAAEWLVRHGVKCVGTDTLSIEKYGSKKAPVHRMLLSSGIGIIESLNANLKLFAGKRMFLVCLPMLLQGVDGSPARAILFDIKS
jgi:arylformamidase